MSIKSILLHMAPDGCRGERLSAAIDLAGRYGAHLKVAYLTSPIGMPEAITGRGASTAYIAEAIAIAEEKAEGILGEVRSACEAASVSCEAEVVSGDHNEELARRSHGADLVVISENRALLPEDYVGLHKPDQLLMESACPVLIIPKGWSGQPIGRRVLIAWKDTREASHAVREALPFLEQAEKIFVLTGDERERGAEGKRILADWLARHGLVFEQLSTPADGDAGAAILGRAKDVEADLLVAGAYGHSRWREIVLGGVTHHILTEMDLPVLMSH